MMQRIHGARPSGIIFLLVLVIFGGLTAIAQKLSPKREELTAGGFVQAIHQAHGLCVLPFGLFENHRPHLPIGADLLDVPYAVMNAVQQEYAVVVPWDY